MQRVKVGQLGSKTGSGFYNYANGKARKGPPGLAQRLLKPLLARAQQRGDEGVVADAGIIFSIGFAPFTDWPLNDLKSLHV
jgi:3-hydroxyacyl-CoA dehydrogenase/enoyl-CoA hydratase/3-hydroxybutyryl-CoA epimerase